MARGPAAASGAGGAPFAVRAGLPRPTWVEWLLLAAGLALVNHYAWILDDAYVYFRYVDNFVDYGHGWVYNEGEYVEGYTSPLWLLALTGLRTLGLDYWLLVRGVGLVSFAVFWWGLVVLDRDLAPARAPGARAVRVNFPLVYLGCNYATLCYFTSGVEAPWAQLVAVAYALFLVRPERPAPALGVALSPLVRPELALALALALGFVWWRRGRFPAPTLAAGVLFTGAWLAFRIFYYADLAPNTFHLKHVSMIGQGLVFVDQSLAAYGAYPLALIAAGAAFALARRGVPLEGWPRLAMLAIATAVALYFVRIGGDPRHHRYLAFSFCLAACSLAGMAERVLDTFAPRLPASVVAAGSLALAFLFGSLLPPQLEGHPIWRHSVHRPVDLINDAEWHRSHPKVLAPPPWSLLPLDFQRTPEEKQRRRRWRSGYERFTSDDWCQTAYWNIDRYVVNSAGLTDAVLARTPTEHVRPAHQPRLRPLARHLAELRRADPVGPGRFRRAVLQGRARPWVAKNLASLEQIERKVYNQHHFFENLKLALTPVPPIEP